MLASHRNDGLSYPRLGFFARSRFSLSSPAKPRPPKLDGWHQESAIENGASPSLITNLICVYPHSSHLTEVRRLGVAEKGAQHIEKTESQPKTHTPARPSRRDGVWEGRRLGNHAASRWNRSKRTRKWRL